MGLLSCVIAHAAPIAGDFSAEFTADQLAVWAIRERVVFYDENYDAHWVEQPALIAEFFRRRGLTVLDAPALTDWLQKRVKTKTAVGTSATFVMGNAPVSIVNAPFADCLLARYLRVGGRVVWLAEIPLYLAQDDFGPIKTLGDEPRVQLLGLSFDKNNYYGINEAPIQTPAAKVWGLEPGLMLVRPVFNRGLAVSFVEDSTHMYSCAGMVNLCPANPLSGFIFVPDYAKPTDEALLRNVFRLASYSGIPVTIPTPTPEVAASLPVRLQCWLGQDNRRSVYLRSESVPLVLQAQADRPDVPVAVRLRVLDDTKVLNTWTREFRLPRGESQHQLSTINLRDLRRGIYSVIAEVTIAGITQTLTRELRVAAPPDHDGTHVALWMSISEKLRRAEYVFNRLLEKGIEPMFVDQNDRARDLALWYGLSFSVRRHGDAQTVVYPPGYDGMRRNGNGEVMHVPGHGTTRDAMGYASPLRRQTEADDFGRQIAEDYLYPAFRQRAVTGDDYAQWFGADYNRYAIEGFQAKYGQPIPRPAAMLDADETRDVERRPGIIPDDDLWLLANRYWSADVLGDMGTRLATAMRQHTDGTGKVGPIPGAMQVPVMQMGSAQYPPFNFGADHGFNLTCFYYYNYYWQPSLVHQWWLDCARMGHRAQEQWIMPDCYIAGGDRAYYRHNGWQILSGGATGLEYFCQDEMTPAGEEAVAYFGQLSHRYGRLLAAIHPAPKTVGFFVPFEQLVYHIGSCFELAYPYLDLLQAKVDIEPVCAEELTAQSIRQYRVIVLAHINWLRQSSVTLLTAYIKAGGTVLIDASTAREIEIPGAIHLPVTLGGTWIADYGQAEKIAMTRKALEAYVTPEVACDNPYIVVRRFTGAGQRYLWVLNSQTGKEYQDMRAAFKQSSEQANACSVEAGFGTVTISTTLTLADDGTIPYDVFAGKPLPVTRQHGQMTVTVAVPKWEATLIAFLPQLPTGLTVMAPTQVKPGQDVPLTVAVSSKTGVVDALFPLRVIVTDPAGKVNIEYTRRMLAQHGQASYHFAFAKNDPPGIWSVEVSDAMTKLRARRTVKLAAP